MNTSKFMALAASIFIFITACDSNKPNFDASGSFEAEETIISSEASGAIKQFNVEEGQNLKKGQVVGYIDSMQLFLKKKQLEAQVKSLNSRLPNVLEQTQVYSKQIAVTQTQLDNLLKEQKRFENLVKSDAATPKQLDDINAQIAQVRKQLEVIKSQKDAQVSVLSTQSSGLKSDVLPLFYQIEQIGDQLQKCQIINPIHGTVLGKYAEANEMAAPGKALYKIADLSTIILRAYISGNQLPQVRINQSVKVSTDDGKGGFKETAGVITWINDKAEFTPKTIQTKDERANMVYAIKVKVKNDGLYKIGMYGEIKFQ